MNTHLIVQIIGSVIFSEYYAPDLLLLLAFSNSINRIERIPYSLVQGLFIVLKRIYVSFGCSYYQLLMASEGVSIQFGCAGFL
jgi:hypothetical protein